MKRALILFLFPLFAIGLFGESASVIERDSVTDVPELLKDEEIAWRFSDTLIARVIENSVTYDDVQFKDRLQLDNQTGDLRITNIRTTDSGLYKYVIFSPRMTSEKTFSVICVRDTGVKPVSVEVGGSVTLDTDVPEIQKYDVIRWRFGQQKSPVAEINRTAGIFSTYEGPDGRFRDRLQLDHQTGSLTIMKTETNHSGLYEVEIGSKHTIHKSFNVTVGEIKTVLVIEGDSVTLRTDTEKIQNNVTARPITDDSRLSVFGIAGISTTVVIILLVAVALTVFCGWWRMLLCW